MRFCIMSLELDFACVYIYLEKCKEIENLLQQHHLRLNCEELGVVGERHVKKHLVIAEFMLFAFQYLQLPLVIVQQQQPTAQVVAHAARPRGAEAHFQIDALLLKLLGGVDRHLGIFFVHRRQFLFLFLGHFVQVLPHGPQLVGHRRVTFVNLLHTNAIFFTYLSSKFFGLINLKILVRENKMWLNFICLCQEPSYEQ
jgi:hypothetical protein